MRRLCAALAARTVEGVVSRTFARTGVMVITARAGIQVPTGAWVRSGGGDEGVVIGQHMHLVFAARSAHARSEEGEVVRIDANERSLGSLTRALHIGGAPLPLSPGELESSVLFAEPVPQSALARISRPLLTGITTIDALTPLGYGQSMVLQGPPSTVKRALAARILASQAATSAVCIHARASHLDDAAEPAAPHVTTVCPADAGASPATGALALASAIAFGCALRSAGRDAIVVADSLSVLAAVWDDFASAIAELLPPAPPGSSALSDEAQLRGFIARFVQQSAPLLSGGSLSLLLLADSDLATDLPHSLLPPLAGRRPQAAGALAGSEEWRGGGNADSSGKERGPAESPIDLHALPAGALTAGELARIESLRRRGISPTLSTLARIGIRPRLPPGRAAERDCGAAPSAAPAAAVAIPPPLAPKRRSSTRARIAEHSVSLGDGHLTLDPRLETEDGWQPPVALGASLSRIGAGTEGVAAAAPALRAIAAGVRFEIVNGADSTTAEGIGTRALSPTRAGAPGPAAAAAVSAVDALQVRRSRAFRSALRQPPGLAPRSLAQSVLLLCAARHGVLDALGSGGTLLAGASARMSAEGPPAAVPCAALERIVAVARAAVPAAVRRLEEEEAALAAPLSAREIEALVAAWRADAGLHSLLRPGPA